MLQSGGEILGIPWDRRNLKTVSTHLRSEEAEALKCICDTLGTTPYKVMRDHLLYIIRVGGSVTGHRPRNWEPPEAVDELTAMSWDPYA